MRRTNEELAMQIKQGKTELIPQLWEQVSKFIAMRAREYIARKQENEIVCHAEVGDLVNQAYFGLLKAIEYFDPERGSFLTILDYSIKTSFSEAAGVETSCGRHDGLNFALSGDSTLGDSDISLFDVISDTGESVEEAATREMYLEQLRKTLDKALSDLTAQQEAVLRARYYEGMDARKIADDFQCTTSNINRVERTALDSLYNGRHLNGLNEFLEENTNDFVKVGIRRYRRTGISAVEEAVFKRDELVQKWMKEHYG